MADERRAGTDVYAYLLNNYWHTNYKADQDGPLTFRFLVRPHGRFDAAALRRFGADRSSRCWPCQPRGPRRSRAPFRVDGPSLSCRR